MGWSLPKCSDPFKKHTKRLLKIVNKNNFITFNNPLNIEQTYALEALDYHYAHLQSKYITSNSKTRNKNIPIPVCHKTISSKSSYIKAVSLFNSLTNTLKVLKKENRRKRLKVWIRENI